MITKEHIDCTIVSWRAWYTEGRKFDSVNTHWEDLPQDGVLVFVLYQRSKGHRRMMCGVSLYWKEEIREGTIYACDNVADALIPDGLSQKYIKRGKWTTDEEYARVREEALQSQQSPDESLRI